MFSIKFKKHYIAFVCIFVAAVVVNYFSSIEKKQINNCKLDKFPINLGHWKMIDNTKFDNRITDILGTKDIIGRIYENDRGRTVNLIMVRAINNRSSFHPPEYCLRGSGYEIINKNIWNYNIFISTRNILKVNEMIFLSQKKEKLYVWNWYVANDYMGANLYMQQINILKNQLILNNGSGMVVNLYVNIEKDNIQASKEICIDFTKFLLPILKYYL